VLFPAPTVFIETQYIGLPRDVVQVCMKYFSVFLFVFHLFFMIHRGFFSVLNSCFNVSDNYYS